MGAPKYIGSRVTVDGRIGTVLSFAVWDYWHEIVAGKAAVVFDDAPAERVAVDKAAMIDVTPALTATTVNGRPAYAQATPAGEYRVLKSGAYWYVVRPGAAWVDPARSKQYSGCNTRVNAVRSALGHYAHTVTPSGG